MMVIRCVVCKEPMERRMLLATVSWQFGVPMISFVWEGDNGVCSQCWTKTNFLPKKIDGDATARRGA